MLEAIFTDPVNGIIVWLKIESLFKTLDCEIIEGNGSRITIIFGDLKATFHRPHPGREALRYRVSAVRDF
ncbi:MAG: type II toxin-antitoxin system HicA family toxin [Desulfobulbaceae bacterium]|nr:type II toxin-antitoxin system HicA family toxin [Desulfobulbaceae bacterium]